MKYFILIYFFITFSFANLDLLAEKIQQQQNLCERLNSVRSRLTRANSSFEESLPLFCSAGIESNELIRLYGNEESRINTWLDQQIDHFQNEENENCANGWFSQNIHSEECRVAGDELIRYRNLKENVEEAFYSSLSTFQSLLETNRIISELEQARQLAVQDRQMKSVNDQYSAFSMRLDNQEEIALTENEVTEMRNFLEDLRGRGGSFDFLIQNMQQDIDTAQDGLDSSVFAIETQLEWLENPQDDPNYDCVYNNASAYCSIPEIMNPDFFGTPRSGSRDELINNQCQNMIAYMRSEGLRNRDINPPMLQECLSERYFRAKNWGIARDRTDELITVASSSPCPEFRSTLEEWRNSRVLGEQNVLPGVCVLNEHGRDFDFWENARPWENLPDQNSSQGLSQ